VKRGVSEREKKREKRIFDTKTSEKNVQRGVSRREREGQIFNTKISEKIRSDWRGENGVLFD
jgi:hypothetical protein